MTGEEMRHWEPLVRQLAGSFKPRPYQINDTDDLVQIGLLALPEARRLAPPDAGRGWYRTFLWRRLADALRTSGARPGQGGGCVLARTSQRRRSYALPAAVLSLDVRRWGRGEPASLTTLLEQPGARDAGAAVEEADLLDYLLAGLDATHRETVQVLLGGLNQREASARLGVCPSRLSQRVRNVLAHCRKRREWLAKKEGGQ